MAPKTTLSDQSRAAVEPSSFRDPSGFLFRDANSVLLRQVNDTYAADFDAMMQSGLAERLVRDGQLIDHEEVTLSRALTSAAVRVLKPREISFVSYPIEWCFSQLKDAALLTLEIALIALQHGMTLKDASAYNIQFDGPKPVFIDTLSFERYVEGKPWVAYSQFCRHFLGPLALWSTRGFSLNQLFATQVDGLDLRMVSALLPKSTLFSPGLLMHVHMHSRFQDAFSDTTRDSALAEKATSRRVSKEALVRILESLRRYVSRLKWHAGGTEWVDYYSANSYDAPAFNEKQAAVRRYLDFTTPHSVWDLGANTGLFSRIAAESGAYTCAFDIDAACVERSYLACQQGAIRNVLPLVMNVTSPTPSLGWSLKERMSLVQRGPCDTILALALIHHVAIGNNVPLPWIAEFLSRLGKHLIIEFVPKTDPQVRRLLRSREDIFNNYSLDAFQASFSQFFDLVESCDVGQDGRRLFLMAAASVS